MKSLSKIFFYIFSLIIVLINGCSPPSVSIVVLDWDGKGSFEETGYISKYSGRIRKTYTTDSFNVRIKSSYESKLYFKNKSSLYADSLFISKDSLVYFRSKNPFSLSVDSVFKFEVFDESAVYGKLWRSVALAGSFAGYEVFGYLGPHKPKANTFAIASGIGLGLGLVFAGRFAETFFIERKSELLMNNEVFLKQ